MARDFDGTDDYLDMGSDASIDDFGAVTLACWIRFDTTMTFPRILEKADLADLNGWLWLKFTGASNTLYFARDFATVDGSWRGSTSLNNGTIYHIATTHDGTTGVATHYINGVVETLAATVTPSGALVADAASVLQAGIQNTLVAELDGFMAHIIYHNAVLTAADINVARWWGRPIGGLKVYHPLFTDKLTNEGSATADATATGTTMLAVALPVVRPGSAMMG